MVGRLCAAIDKNFFPACEPCLVTPRSAAYGGYGLVVFVTDSLALWSVRPYNVVRLMDEPATYRHHSCP